MARTQRVFVVSAANDKRCVARVRLKFHPRPTLRVNVEARRVCNLFGDNAIALWVCAERLTALFSFTLLLIRQKALYATGATRGT